MSGPSNPALDNSNEVDLSGQRLAGYRLKHRIGRGGMADVYLADQESLRRPVALKVLRRDLAKNEKYVRRFQNEAHAAASLIDGSIVQIHEVSSIGEWHFIAQEYVNGENLGQMLVRHGPIEERLAVHILIQASHALKKAAEAGIVHRDIKPENIMVTRQGEVKVADFGLARINNDEHSVNLTQVGITLGTPLYMSPEQVEGKPLDTRSDIYSLGVTAYHMLSGRPPFKGENAFTVALKHLKEEPEPLKSICPHLSDELCRLVHRMMAKDRDDRISGPVELARALYELQPNTNELANRSLELNSPVLADLVQSDLATTQRLETVMISQQMLKSKPLSYWPIAVMVLLAIGIGGGCGWWFRPTSILTNVVHDHPKIEIKESARNQYYYATQLNTEEAWLSIEKNFPASGSDTNRYYGLRAKQRRAELYFEQREFERAKTIYAELASITSDLDVQFRAAGLVGLCNIHVQNKEISTAKKLLTDIVNLLPALRRQNDSIADGIRDRLDRQLWNEFEEIKQAQKAP